MPVPARKPPSAWVAGCDACLVRRLPKGGNPQLCGAHHRGSCRVSMLCQQSMRGFLPLCGCLLVRSCQQGSCGLQACMPRHMSAAITWAREHLPASRHARDRRADSYTVPQFIGLRQLKGLPYNSVGRHSAREANIGSLVPCSRGGQSLTSCNCCEGGSSMAAGVLPCTTGQSRLPQGAKHSQSAQCL